MLLSGERFISLSVFLISVSAIAREVLFSVFAAFFLINTNFHIIFQPGLQQRTQTPFCPKKSHFRFHVTFLDKGFLLSGDFGGKSFYNFLIIQKMKGGIINEQIS